MLTYWTCRNYGNLPAESKTKIDALCQMIGNPAEALKQAVTSGDRLLDVAMEFGLSESVLYQQVRRFFREW